jgi:hypothetical protein
LRRAGAPCKLAAVSSSPRIPGWMAATAACTVVLAVIASCGGTTSLNALAGERDRREPNGSCRWPARLDRTDAAFGQCRAALKLLSCTSEGGSGSICVSNEDWCPFTPPPSFECSSECVAGEYAAQCGAVGTSADPPSPACRSVIPTPGGVVFYCCPCGS